MVGRVRHRLRRVRYYSARPERSFWREAMDRVLIGSLLLAILIGPGSAGLLARSTVVETTSGWISLDGEGAWTARLWTEGMTSTEGDAGPVVDLFTLQIIDRTAGWPFACVQQERPLHVRLHSSATEAFVPLSALEGSEGLREAIGAAVRDARPDLASRLGGGRSEWSGRWMLMNIAMWWMMLYVLGLLALIPLRLMLGVVRRQQIERERRQRQSGFCAGCGYNLRGLEFRARCPECGRLAY